MPRFFIKYYLKYINLPPAPLETLYTGLKMMMLVSTINLFKKKGSGRVQERFSEPLIGKQMFVILFDPFWFAKACICVARDFSP